MAHSALTTDIGRIFELGFNLGVLAAIQQKELTTVFGDEYATDARALRLAELVAAIAEREHLVSTVDQDIVEQWVIYFLLKGYFAGLTFLREYLAAISGRTPPHVAYFQCKLYDENSLDTYQVDSNQALGRLMAQLKLSVSTEELARYQLKGEFLKADTLLLLALPREYRILAVDVSVFLVRAVRDLRDLRNVEVLRQLLRSEVSYLRSKSVFSGLTIDTATLDLPFSEALKRYFRAFVRSDKESAKLIQAASYADSFYDFLLTYGVLTASDTLIFNVVGYSDRGVNTLTVNDSQRHILHTCAEIYKHQPSEQDTAAARREMLAAITSSAARSFGGGGDGRRFIEELLESATQVGEELSAVRFTEQVTGFVNTSDATPPELLEALDIPTLGTLRDSHAALIRKMLTPAASETILFLTGNPGIGKTTAIVEFLKEHIDEGFLFLYASPRKQVNLDVVEKFSSHEHGTLRDNRLLSLNTNADIIRNHNGRATVQYRSNVREGDFEAHGVQFIDERVEREHRMGRTSRLRRATESIIQDTGARQSGVLHSISTALSAVMTDKLASAVVATVSIQALKKTNRGDTLDHFKAIFKDAYNERAGHVIPAKLQALARRMRHLFIMIDEVTGDESGVEFLDRILQVLQQLQLTNPAHGFNTKVIVADASIVDAGVIAQHLATRAPERDKIFFRKVRTGTPALSYEPTTFKRLPATVINANSYPATGLDLHYTVLFETVPYTEHEMLKGRQSLPKRVQAELGADVQRLLEDPDAGQIIVYMQDKRRLAMLIDALRAVYGTFVSGEDYAEIHADLSEAQKRELLAYKDQVRIIFMTASASRGLSFPKTRHLLIVVPSFDIEHNLMEIIQVLYRGRGGPLDQTTKVVRFYLADRIVYDLDDPDRRMATQERALNLINLLVILKTSIMTRIQGYGILGREKCLMIPIGGKSVHAAGESVSNQLTTLIKDLHKEHYKRPDRQLAKLADRLSTLLGRSEILIDGTTAGDLSAQSFLRLLHSVESSLFEPLHSGLHTLLELPTQQAAYLNGSLLVVPMAERRVQEQYEMRLWDELNVLRNDDLVRKMREVAYNDQQYPERLRSGMRQALELVQMMDASRIRTTQRFEQTSERADQYYAVPLWTLLSRQALAAYFASDSTEPEDESFHELLALYIRTLYPVDGILPIGSRYGAFPFVMFRSYSLGELRQKVFTDHHLLTSQELSVLNMMLAST